MSNCTRRASKHFLISIILGLVLVSCDFAIHPSPAVEISSGPIRLPPKWTVTATRSYEEDSEEILVQTQVAYVGSSHPGSTPTPSHLSEQTPIAFPTPRATRTPKSQPPSFSGLGFASASEPMMYQYAFPCGIRQVYAMWEYSNMREGMIIRREWFYDFELWLVREEPWDFQKYGEHGVVTDIFIYDYENGLEPGYYDLDLYIDGNLAEAGHGFHILGWVVDPLPSPNGSWIASVERPGTLVVQDRDGKQRVLIETDEIAGLAWFPDGKHLIYTDVDRSRQFDPSVSMGLQFELWVVNVKTKERYRLSTAEERLRKPAVSPDGRYIAAIVGSGWGDACLYDKSLVFLSLDQSLHRVAKYETEEFYGIVSGNPLDTWSIYPGQGIWIDSTSYLTELHQHCLPEFEEGVYILDLSTFSATKVSDLSD